MSSEAIRVIWHPDEALPHSVMVAHLSHFGDMMPIPLSQHMDLRRYADKVLANASIALAEVGGRIVGLVILYANDDVTKEAHIPLLSVDPCVRRRGVASILIQRAIVRARARGMRTLTLRTLKTNTAALSFYSAMGFRITSEADARFVLRKDIPEAARPEAFAPTPLESRPDLSAAFNLNIDLRVKRDDLYPLPGGGIKSRKILHIIRSAVDAEHGAVVTNGAPQSNHARATAIEAARLGLPCHIVIVVEPGHRYRDSGNFLLMRLSGATLEFCAKTELAARMDRAVSDFAAKGLNPLYIWGGGHCIAGTEAFVVAASEARTQCSGWHPDYLVIASGTGTTQAGLVLGYADTATRVIGISVAREANRGAAVVQQAMEEYIATKGGRARRIEFLDEWTEGGYERIGDELVTNVQRAARHGLFLDTTYSGKAWTGLIGLVQRGDIAIGSKVLFWHTGGLLNLQTGALVGPDIVPIVDS